MNAKIIIVVAILVALGAAYPTTGHCTSTEASQEAVRIALIAVGSGVDVQDEFQQGYLAKGQKTVTQLYLSKGQTYVLVASGCEDAYDIDLAIVDENGNLINKDTDNGKTAVVRVTPRWSGKFYAVIKMANSTSDGAHWALVTAHVQNS